MTKAARKKRANDTQNQRNGMKLNVIDSQVEPMDMKSEIVGKNCQYIRI